MFQSEPDPAWEYAPLWEDMKEIYFKMKEIEMKLSHPDGEQENKEVDSFVVSNLKEIKETCNKWTSSCSELFQIAELEE
jgi:tRNA(Phe) wybutosine-synthesizing methylase Tyw3